MKSSILLSTALASLFVTAAFAAPAATTAPVPVKVVHPVNLPPSYENETVEVTFMLDAAGVPHNVKAVDRIPEQVSKNLLPAVAQWRFTPFYKDGQATPTRIVLPLKLINGPLDAKVQVEETASAKGTRSKAVSQAS